MEDIEHFDIQNLNTTFNDLIKEVSRHNLSNLKENNVIILPSHGYKDLYYKGTLNTLDYLNEHDISADICATDEEYQEVLLHGLDIWLGTFLIKYVAIPIFNIVIGNYIFNKLKAKPDDNISLEFVVEQKDGNIQRVEYRGKVEDLDKAMSVLRDVESDS